MHIDLRLFVFFSLRTSFQYVSTLLSSLSTFHSVSFQCVYLTFRLSTFPYNYFTVIIRLMHFYVQRVASEVTDTPRYISGLISRSRYISDLIDTSRHISDLIGTPRYISDWIGTSRYISDITGTP